MSERCRSSGGERCGRYRTNDSRQAGMGCRDDRSLTSWEGGQDQVHHYPTPAGRSRGCLTGKHGGKVFMFRGTIACGRVTVPIACSVIATMLPFSAATAEDGIPAGGAAVYQDAGQDASTGEWVEPATADPLVADAVAPDQGVAPAPTEVWVEPVDTDAATDTASKEALVDSTGSVDPATGEWTDPGAADPASSAGGVDS